MTTGPGLPTEFSNSASFGRDADAYRAFRPVYPAALYGWLTANSPGREAALDVATGNGQAARQLAQFFARVHACDNSAGQLAAAAPHPRITYARHAAEDLSAAPGPFDLVTIAQGAHWIELDRFYAALAPLLVPRALVAIWGYSHPNIDPQIDAVLDATVYRPIAPYWAAGSLVMFDHYTSIPFPYAELPAPTFSMTVRWSRARYFDYVRTLSAHRRLVLETGSDPLATAAAALEPLWPAQAVRPIRFPLHMRAGRFG